ncbi:hypothetical protein [Marinobacter sp.]|uniref:hypothetical protein n=1 Tax=Marinobacter sp. TaxID=50741 RepID=UPI003A91ED3F
MKGSPDASLSFLDVLACALGGSALLFLILTTLPHSGANAPKVSDAITASTVEVTPALAGAPAPAPPKLFRIEHPAQCQLRLDDPDAEAVVLGEAYALTDRGRPEHWLRLGPRDNASVQTVVLKFEECPSGEAFVIRAVHYSVPLEPIIYEILTDHGTLSYDGGTSEKWSLK